MVMKFLVSFVMYQNSSSIIVHVIFLCRSLNINHAAFEFIKGSYFLAYLWIGSAGKRILSEKITETPVIFLTNKYQKRDDDL